MNENKQELLELYKLHATLADNVTKNRGNVNSVYVSLLSAALFFYVRLINLFETHLLYVHRPNVANLLIIGGAVLGILLATTWLLIINHYRKLNQAKFECLNQLEQQLSYQFFEQEWNIATSHKSFWEFTRVERVLPIIFIIAFIIVATLLLSQYPYS